ncbi:MAG: archaeal heat shock protein Hsp20 [Candidatus Altiarchaeota archaeon]
MFPKKGRRGLFDEFFGDFDSEFRRMEENMAHVFNQIKEQSGKNVIEGEPFVYGFSMRIGPDGRPQIEEFGNLSKGITKNMEVPGREPLTDLIEGDDEITIIAEIPGIDKEDIELDVDEENLSINVDTSQRKYHKSLIFPCNVEPDSGKASYKNGVLEVKFKRQKPKPGPEKTKIKID